MNIEYPILPSYGDKPTDEQQENTIAKYYGNQNRAGFFPLGVNNTWHGGIHIEDFGTQIRAIADGRIIAYRIPKDYLTEKGNENAKYSNGFILIQHNFETPQKIKFHFYSLYMHLQPKTEMEKNKKGKNIPDLYAKYTVKTRIDVRETGLRVREYCEGDTTKQESEEVKFIPKGGLLKKDTTTPPKGHWMHKKEGKNYTLCKVNGRILCAYKPWLLDYSEDTYQVDHLKAKDINKLKSSSPTGTMLFNAIKGKYIGMECKDVELEIELTTNKHWYKIKNTNNFVLVKDCTGLIKKIKDDVKLDTVENVDVPIKAGQIIGVPSKYEGKARSNYTTVHLEVFSDDKNLANFINNTKDKDRTSFEVAKDKTLQVAKPCNFLKKDAKVKIYQTKDSFTQIGFENIEKITTFDSRLSWNDTDRYYRVKNFEQVNADFDRLLPNNHKKLYFVEYYKKEADGTFSKTTKGDENLAKLKAKKNKEEFTKYRKLKYKHPKAGKKYWVKSSEVTGNLNDWVSLKNNITVVFEEEPSATTPQNIVVENTTKVRKINTTKDSQNIEWWQIKVKKQQGWIKKSDLIKKNPYNWTDYGWKIQENTGSQYFYMFGDFVDQSEPHKFVKKIWEIADVDGNKVLSNLELRRAMTNKTSLNNISKLICKHPNEWNTWKNIRKFENEFKSATQKEIDESEGFDSEGNNLKEKLLQLRDTKKEMLKDKIKHLCFWDKIQTGDLVPVSARREEYVKAHSGPIPMFSIYDKKEEEIKIGKKFDALEAKRIPRSFPKSDNVYHFHPIAFVEHMKLLITKEDIDLRGNNSKWQTQFDSRFGNKKRQNVACWRACQVILGNYNVTGGNLKNNKALFQVAIEKDNQLVVVSSVAIKAIDYLDKQLEMGKPILVGVDHTYKYKGGFNNDLSTDHFVVIIGRGNDEKGEYYLFYEVGTSYKSKGASDNNKLYVQEDYSLKGPTVYKPSHVYTITQVRENQ